MSSEATLRAEQAAALVEFSDDAILSKDRDALITSWNPAAERIYGYTAEEAIGQPVAILIPPHRSGEERVILNRVLAGERVDHYETERVTKDGRLKMLSLTVSPMYDDAGEVVGASVIARDITAQHHSRRLTEQLQTLTTELSKEIAPERALDVLLEQAVGALGADAGSIGMLGDDPAQVQLVGSIGHSAAGLEGWERFPLASNLPMCDAIRRNEPVWITSAADLTERFPDLATADIRFEALAVLPLAVEGRPFGAVALSFEGSREFDLEERTFLSAAVQQAAYMLERARLFQAERAAGERLSFVAEASDVLSRSLDPEELLQGLAALAVDRFADWCSIDLTEADGDIRSVAVAHKDPGRVALAEEMRTRYPADPGADTGAAHVIRTGEPELYREIPDELLVESARDEEHLSMARELGLVSAMIVPLRTRGRTLGALTLVSSESGRRFGETDLELAEDLARRAALAIDNAMLYRREHEAAVILQRALLPDSLPEVPGIEFAARYEPAAPGLEVGGDWYEVVARDDGTLGIMIGDVAGRGIRAASTMGRLRPALRGFVAAGHPPDEVIRLLDSLIKEGERPELTTVFHVQYDPRTGVGEYVRAGHPPAMLRLPDGSVTELRGRGSPPVGIVPDAVFRTQRFEVPPGSLLLLYTDGLIERPGADLEVALTQLREAVAGCSGGAATCLDSLAASYGTDRVPDDVAMLAMAVSINGPNGAT